MPEEELTPEEEVTEPTSEEKITLPGGPSLDELTPEEPTPAPTLPEDVVECPKCQTPMNKTDTGYACPKCGYFKAT